MKIMLKKKTFFKYINFDILVIFRGNLFINLIFSEFNFNQLAKLYIRTFRKSIIFHLHSCYCYEKFTH